MTQHILNKGMMQNCMYLAKAKTAEDEYTGDGPIYDFYLEDGVVGSCQGPDSLKEVAALGQAMVVQQRPDTGTLGEPGS